MTERPRIRTYRLVGKTAVPCGDFVAGFVERMMSAQETGEDPWRVAFTAIGGKKSVSTVFLGMDHSYFGGEPRIFETAVFNGETNVEIVSRCATWEQAEVMHEQAVLAAKTSHLKVIK